MFGFGKKRREQAEVRSALEKIAQLLTDDDLQIRVLGPKNYSAFKNLSAIDAHPNAEGEFGRAPTNPIPTNGPIGSLAYLSQLLNQTGKQILFHRVNTVQNVDIYEYVTLDAQDWNFLFVDMYHSRKSKLAPSGFSISARPLQLSGVNHYWDDFPMGFAEQKHAMPKDVRLLCASIQSIADKMALHSFRPSDLHLAMRETIANIPQQ